MTAVLSDREVHVGAVRGRYFRENFAQGGGAHEKLMRAFLDEDVFEGHVRARSRATTRRRDVQPSLLD